MSEKEMLLNVWKREFDTTLKVLKNYPEDKADLKPAEKLRPAKELIGVLVQAHGLTDAAINGALNMQLTQTKPAGTIADILKQFESHFKADYDKVKAMSESDLNQTIDFFVAAGQMGKVRRMDLLWLVIMDMVHHRGQISVYQRIAGGKVPSIYGPSGDEPWF
jgi:uncharacterized damage-inducible protein DinB